jgi:iron complex outermembrane receptor protein
VKELNFSAAFGLHKENYGFEIFASRFHTDVGILKGTAIGNIEDLLAAMNGEEPLYTAPFSYDINQPRQEVSHDLIKLNAHMKSMGGEWRVQYGYQQNNRKEFDIRRTSLVSIPALNLDLSTHTVEAEWEREKSEDRTLCIGITSLIQTNTNVPGTQRIPFIPNFANYSGGFFGVIQRLIGKWKWDAGLRFDYRGYVVKGYDYKNSYFNDQLTFANASGTLGANIQINTKNAFHWNISSAWRPPHVSELYSLGTHQSAGAIEYGLLLKISSRLSPSSEKFLMRMAVQPSR